MLYRKIQPYIESYLKSDSNKVLIIDGARQIGKTFIIRYVGQQFFENYIELNFAEDYNGPRLFEQVRTVKDFYFQVSTIAGERMGEKKNTLIFLDEIQAYPHLLTMPCIESLDALEPCGNGNPKPLLCITGARLVNAVPIGGGRHLRLHFSKGGYNYAGIFFSCTPAQLGVRIGQWVDVAFTPQINEFRGRRSVQLLVTDVRPSDPLPLCRALLKNQCIPAWDTVDLYPLRADFAVAWRWLNAPVAFPLEELPARAPMRPEKFCVCLRVMAEMGLAAVDFDGETLRLRPLPTSGKVDLGASKLLQTLRERRQSLL